jgi:hypothetical protein
MVREIEEFGAELDGVLNRFGEAQSGARESWSQPRNAI